MNVTIKLPDDLCRQARHRAVDDAKSLSAWMAELVRRELNKPAPASRKPLIERIGDTDFLEDDLPLPERKASAAREVRFP